jgi:hypothetical protein
MTQPVTWADLMQNAKGQLEPIPDGDYDVKVIDAQATQSSTGKPMWKVKFEVTSGPHAPRKVFSNFTLSDDNPMALAIFFRQMEAMGLNAAFFAALSQNFEESKQQIAQALMNRTCRVTLGQRQFQGRAMQDVKTVLPPLTGGPVAPGVATGPVVPTPGGMPVPSPTAVPTPTSVPTPGPQVGPGPQAPSGPPPLPI